jgi:hypothetical protein
VGKYFVIVLALPLALFLLLDPRKSLSTSGPWLALAVALVMAPHVVWLPERLSPLHLRHARHASRGLLDHVLHPAVFAGTRYCS